MAEETLEEKINKRIAGLPRDLRESVNNKVTFYKAKGLSNEEIYQEIAERVRLEMLAYLDSRPYLGMYNRKFLEKKMADYIEQIVSHGSGDERLLFSLTRVNFDLNGLKTLNDLAGHEAGNRGLKSFSNILNFGATTLWLRNELGLEIYTSAEGGDEFGLIAYGSKDLRPYAREVVERYGKEVLAYDASDLINFSDKTVRQKLELLGVADDVPRDFKFKLSSSVGMSVFGEAIVRVPVAESGKTYDEVVGLVIKEMFRLTDERSSKNKSEFKRKLAKENVGLSAPYSRMSREVIHLERRIKELEEELGK